MASRRDTSTQEDSLADAISALMSVRDHGALVDLAGEGERGRNIVAVAVALARCLHRVDDRSLGELATRARELLRDRGRLGAESDGDSWVREADWRRGLVDDVARSIRDGRAENQHWLARFLRRRFTVNRYSQPTPAILEALSKHPATGSEQAETATVLELETLDRAIARELTTINTTPVQADTRTVAIACVRAALKALGATAAQRKSWLAAEQKRSADKR